MNFLLQLAQCVEQFLVLINQDESRRVVCEMLKQLHIFIIIISRYKISLRNQNKALVPK